jgi:hypothetical protein
MGIHGKQGKTALPEIKDPSGKAQKICEFTVFPQDMATNSEDQRIGHNMLKHQGRGAIP